MGQDYEVALCSLFFLRALRISSDFYLASNHNLAGKFDDLALFYRLKGDSDNEYNAILLQAKHKTRVAEEQLTVNSPFKLIEYLESFKKNKHLWEKPLVVDGRRITLKNITIALFTNTGCQVGDAASDVTNRPEIHLLQDFLNTEGRLLRIPEAQRVGLSKEPDISDFLGQLLLCVNQMNIITADQFLQKELYRALRLTSEECVTELTSGLKSVMKTWWSEEGKGRYLTPDCEEWKKILQLQVTRLNADSLIVNSDIVLGFTAAALEALDVVQRYMKMTWITATDKYQASMTRERIFRAQKNSLVLSDKYLELHREEIEALWGNYCSTLAIDLTNYPKCEASKLLQRHQEAAQKNEARHLVVIATEQPAHIEEWNVVEPLATWSALDTDTQERLLSVKVQLQGNAPVELRDIVDSSVTDLMTDYVIKSLVLSESAIKIGDAMPPPSDYYVPRCLRRTSSKHINIESLDNTNTLIFQNNFYRPDLSRLKISSPLDLKTKDKIEGLTLVQGRCSDSYIRNMCCTFGVKGIKGDMEKKGFRQEVAEFIPFPWVCADKFIVVEGVPGVGKSSYVTAMCSSIKERFPETWVLRVDMRKHTEFLKEADFSKTDDVIDFLLHGLPKGVHSLEHHLLKHALNFTGKVFLFLDAFDEISPEYTAKCCDLLKGIPQGIRFRQMVVTTRPVTTKDIEEALGAQAFTLPVFSKTEQTLFLKEFSVAKGKNILQWEITSLRESAGPVIEIPLVCKMVAEVLLNHHDQSLLQYKDPWRRVLLYKLFVEQSVEHYLSWKLKLEAWRPGRKNIIANTLKHHLHNLQGLAVRKLIPAMNISNLDVSMEEPDEVLGLVVNTGEAVNFEHRTFAEYFLGCWLSNNWRKCPQKILRDVFQQGGFDFVSATFSWSLFEEFPLHMAVARGDVRAVKGQLVSGTIDHGGRSALHVAALTADNVEVSEVLVASCEDLNIPDAIVGETAARFAEVTKNWELLELMHKKGATLEDLKFFRDENAITEVIINAVEKELTSLLKYILNMHKRLLHSHVDAKGNTLLHIATAYNCILVLELLLDMKHSVNVKNFEGNTPLHGASVEGRIEVVRLLVDNGADPSIENDQGETSLKLAVSKDKLEIVKIFIGLDKDTRKKYRETAMLLAASEGKLEIIKLLIKEGVDTYVKDDDGKTPLTLVGRINHLDVAELLINSGKRNINDEAGRAASTLADREGHTEMVKLLDRNGVTTDIKNKIGNIVQPFGAAEVDENIAMSLSDGMPEKGEDGDAILMKLAFQDNLDIIKFVIQTGCNVNKKNGDEVKAFSWADLKDHLDEEKSGGPPVFTFAAYKGCLKVLKLLAEIGGDVNVRDHEGETALTWAAREGHLEIVKLLIEYGADVNVKNKYSDTSLILAGRKGHEVIVKLLIESGADIDIRDENGFNALTLAASEGHVKVVEVLLKDGLNGNFKNNDGNTAVLLAASNGHNNVVKLFLENGSDVNTKNKYGNNTFTLAAHNGRLNMMKLLIERGAETNITDVEGDSALTLAAVKGHLNVVKFLLEKGFDVNIKNNNGESALTLAAFEGHLDIVKLILENGCDINTKNSVGNNAFSVAAFGGQVEVVQFLIESGADTDIKDVHGNTALMLAAQNGHLKVVKMLLDKGFDVKLKNNNKESALTLAASQRHLDVIKLLLQNGCDVNTRNRYDNDAFTLDARNGRPHVMELLIERGADTNIKDVEGNNLLTLAAAKGHLNIVKFLLEKGFDVNIKNNNEDSALTLAASEGHLDMVKLLLENGCDINTKNNVGNNLFNVAAFDGQVEVVQFLIESGADTDINDVSGNSALILAAQNGHLKVVKMLLEKGFDVKLKNNNEESALTLAASEGHLDVAKLLLENGSDVNMINIYGQNAFHLAACFGHLEVVQFLIENGADRDVKDVDGNSTLMLAAREGHFKVVKLLLNYGCDIKLKNKNGHTALQLAARKGHDDIVKLLKENESYTSILKCLCCFMEG